MPEKFVLVYCEPDIREPRLIVASETEAKAIKKIIDPEDKDYLIYPVMEL